ncbi:MAG: excinuclease ABC subunit UvrA [Cyclobacteriaceae bacterium]|nr:excinuclease ABC subunit UvrA [Cyclobacteriaceae bacterium]MCH8517226.1 excinuclease ABC subunit UvrA [Cyclobacteriaceae bacterium]
MSNTTATLSPKIEDLDPQDYIIIKGAAVNNLKGIDLAIPRNKLVVVTGVSGSGKSSLAFDTLYAEGQRMYVESLNSYARQFLGRMEKPAVEYIKGISPAIAIEQKVNTRNPRSTVGTSTEIYDYLKLLFARIGKTYSPISGKEVRSDSVTDVVNAIHEMEEGTKLLILTKLKLRDGRNISEELELLLSKGYSRVVVEDKMMSIEDALTDLKALQGKKTFIVIDRAVASTDEETTFRLSDSIQTTFFEGEGDCFVQIHGGERFHYSDRFEADGMTFEVPSANFFSFNNPYGACRTCEGFGNVLGIDEDLIIPNKSLSVFEGAIVPWKGETMKQWVEPLLKHGIEFDFPIHRPVEDLSPAEYQLLWEGNEYFEGLNAFFEFLQEKSHKIQYRVMLSRFRGRKTCPDCKGTRLRKDTSYVKIGGQSIIDLVLMPIDRLVEFFDALELDESQQKIARRILSEIENRLGYLMEVGLGYLTLNRLTSTLSGGEYQRIKLATSLGSALVGSMYILDEPSIGLHPRDTARLIQVLERLRDMGNTVIVVEHEEEVMKAADEVIDIGPYAGNLGGELIFQGDLTQLMLDKQSLTAKYLRGEEFIALPKVRRKFKHKITVKDARENNLKKVTVDFPLEVMTVVTGVSGSGKSTLIKKVLHPALNRALGNASDYQPKLSGIEGDIKKIDRIEFVDQNPIGKSSRSNPVTYVKAYDGIRQLFSEQPLSKQRGYKPSFFSFNVDGGRCEACQGEGVVKIEMQFMADIYLNCESCKGKRFKDEILEVEYQGKNIADILDLTVDESIEFFDGQRSITSKLLPLQEVGLGYLGLGQSSNTLSGGEAQRVKLASFLMKGASTSAEKILFIFDEPTTGLHFHDIEKLMHSMNALVDQGNTVLVIEHNVEVIKSADWVIDIGPEGGEQGGQIQFVGYPEDLARLKDNYTGKYLAEKIKD